MQLTLVRGDKLPGVLDVAAEWGIGEVTAMCVLSCAARVWP
ncbi:hypothetical protein ABZZ36_43120 [Actinacidiphila glaucinigra]